MAQNYQEPKIIFGGWTAPEGTGIIVTGAASGIGAATAILAAKGGYKVAAWDMFAEGIQETIERAEEAGKNIKPIQADLSSDEAVDQAWRGGHWCVDYAGRLRCLYRVHGSSQQAGGRTF